MSEETQVSVVIPTFRREREVLEAVASALAQRGVSLEVIVVDDTPEGSAREAITAVGDARVSYLCRAEPSGGRPSLVRNDGAAQAKGRYLHFLDDDDQLEDGALAALVQALETHPHAGMAFGIITPFGADPQQLESERRYFERAAATGRSMNSVRQFAGQMLFGNTIIVTSACMVRRQAFEDAGGFDPQIQICEDVELWTRIGRAAGFVFVDRPVMRYRIGAPSLTHKIDPNDNRVTYAYGRMYDRYRRAHGSLEFYFLKLRARIRARLHRAG